MTTEKNIQIVEGDLTNSEHAAHFLKLTAAFMSDEMGGGAQPWNEAQKVQIIHDIANDPYALVLFAVVDGAYSGICTSFLSYSTFQAKPMLNIHDIFVEEPSRGIGIGKRLLEKAEEVASLKKCCKITISVRKDNLNGRDMYKSYGFAEAPNSRLLWTKCLQNP